MKTETESTIPPFVFVDGKKYVLAEAEERPEPDIFSKLTQPPRNVSSVVRWRLFLCREGDLWLLAFFLGALFCSGLSFLLGDDIPFFGFFTVFFVSVLPFVLISIDRTYSAMRASSNTIQLLQDGLAGKGRFFGMCATGKKVSHAVEMQLQYQFTTHDGDTCNAFFQEIDANKLIKISDESLKLIFYDPMQPNRNVLFNTLPKGIEFDEENGTFYTRPSFLMIQVLWLGIAFSAIPLIVCAVILLSR